jgi:hypothetical protein
MPLLQVSLLQLRRGACRLSFTQVISNHRSHLHIPRNFLKERQRTTYHQSKTSNTSTINPSTSNSQARSIQFRIHIETLLRSSPKSNHLTHLRLHFRHHLVQSIKSNNNAPFNIGSSSPLHMTITLHRKLHTFATKAPRIVETSWALAGVTRQTGTREDSWMD